MKRIALVVALLWCASGVASGGGFGIPEIGFRETAMGAVLGRPDDGTAIYHNPAGLALVPGWQILLSTGLALPNTELRLAPWPESDRFLGATPEADGYYAPVKPSRAFAVIPMLAITGEILPHRLYAGLALYVGNATGAQFDQGSVARYHLIDGYIIAPQLMAAASYQLRDDLAIGAALGVVNMRVHGHRLVYPILQDTDVSSIIGTRADLQLDGEAWAPAWSIGAFGRPHPRITWGATIVGRIDATLEGPVVIAYSDDSQAPGDTLEGRQKTSLLLPWTFEAGVAVDVSPNIEIGVEGRYWLYHQYKRQHSDIVGIFLLRELDTPKNYADSWQVSGGVRVHDLAALPRVELMTGAKYDKSPAPANTITLDQPVFTHFGIHAGVRYAFDRYRIGASYTHYWYDVPTITDSLTIPPTNLQGHGDNHILTLSLEAKLR